MMGACQLRKINHSLLAFYPAKGMPDGRTHPRAAVWYAVHAMTLPFSAAVRPDQVPAGSKRSHRYCRQAVDSKTMQASPVEGSRSLSAGTMRCGCTLEYHSSLVSTTERT